MESYTPLFPKLCGGEMKMNGCCIVVAAVPSTEICMFMYNPVILYSILYCTYFVRFHELRGM